MRAGEARHPRRRRHRLRAAKPYEGHGYAFEAARATLGVARDRFELTRIAGVVDPANARSIRLLERLELAFSHDFTWPDDATRVAIYTGQL